MHDSPKLTSFIALRANGWSLASIAREIDVPKSTLWEWDTKHQDEIYQLKHLQLERLQEKYLPTYEEELSRLRSYLDRIEAALEHSGFEHMQPGGLLQMALQLRSRLAKVRDRLPMREEFVSDESVAQLAFTGRVTHQNAEELGQVLGPLELETENPKPDKTGRKGGGVKK